MINIHYFINKRCKFEFFSKRIGYIGSKRIAFPPVHVKKGSRIKPDPGNHIEERQYHGSQRNPCKYLCGKLFPFRAVLAVVLFFLL